ncbi:MAG: hypothetical protein J2P21_20285 [Chloracidobacterium sp.]|nr:hypothetical protein [Chloracidobacterium sp.]
MKLRFTVQHITNFNRTRSALIIVFFAALIAIPGARSAHTIQTAAPSAEEIIRKAISAYASCTSYMDVGRVQTTFISERGRRTEVKPFSTSFVRRAPSASSSRAAVANRNGIATSCGGMAMR